MIKHIYFPIYNAEIVLLQVKKMSHIPKKYLPDFELNKYRATVYKHILSDGYIVYVMFFPKKTCSRSIAHESFHCINRIFYERNIRYKLLNDEHPAYCIGWLVDKCHQYLKLQ